MCGYNNKLGAQQWFVVQLLVGAKISAKITVYSSVNLTVVQMFKWKLSHELLWNCADWIYFKMEAIHLEVGPKWIAAIFKLLQSSKCYISSCQHLICKPFTTPSVSRYSLNFGRKNMTYVECDLRMHRKCHNSVSFTSLVTFFFAERIDTDSKVSKRIQEGERWCRS